MGKEWGGYCKFVRRESRQGGSYSDGYKNAYYERAGCYGDYSQEG